jgi:hypothetical protein
LVLVHQSTFFEKAKPSAIERKLRLGEPARANQEQMFANFRRFNAPFFEHRQELAQRLGIPLAQVAAPERLNFMDEFHLTLESLGELSQAVADAIDPLIASGSPA